MRVFGIDCGTEFTGYGVVETDEDARMPRLVHLAAGTIRLNKKEKTPQRLAQVYAELVGLIALYEPSVIAIEDVFFAANVKSALKLGQVRGVALLAAANCGLPVAEYAPLSVKSAVVGYGLPRRSRCSSWSCGFLDWRRSPTPRMPRTHSLSQSAMYTRRKRWLDKELDEEVLARGDVDGLSAVAAGQMAKVSFQFDREGLATPRYSMTVAEDGRLTYHAELAGARDSGSAAPVVDRVMALSANTTARIFELARASEMFRIVCASKAKNIADTGQKTLRYVGPDGTGECTFNYSEIKSVAALTDLFLSTEATLEAGRRMDFKRRFDRLGLDAEMITLGTMMESHQASNIETIAGTLRAIANDTELLARVRSRADVMLRMVDAAR